MFYAHDSSVISEQCRIGEGTNVWHFCHIMEGAEIGANCVIGQNCFVAPGVKIGDGCRIQNNVSLYSGVVLAEDVFVGPSVVFTNVGTPRAFVPRKDAFLPTVVKKGASIGANATIVCGNTLSKYCLVGAGAVVTDFVKPHSLVVGTPAKHSGWVCECGERLLDFGDDNLSCPECSNVYIEGTHRIQKL